MRHARDLPGAVKKPRLRGPANLRAGVRNEARPVAACNLDEFVLRFCRVDNHLGDAYDRFGAFNVQRLFFVAQVFERCEKMISQILDLVLHV